ncbi:hypothetical protein PF008_g2227 [Phytophthora fragariae]|uniref:Uncharacterized protein n=1 Tax=Phytophthora fragariae TaxID=53985 RepID=A0A6G0SJN4_9STRA|nr:hypothetical protein PF008_g2227 [Phytophthora fragariae]
MLTQYVRIRDEIKKVYAVFDLIPKATMHRRIEALLEDLKIFNNVTVKPQAQDLSLADAKVMLTPLRVSLLPVNIAMLMFLRTNRSYWDLATVRAIYQQAQCFGARESTLA